MVYATAVVMGGKPKEPKLQRGKRASKPKWESNMEATIERIRKDLSLAETLLKGGEVRATKKTKLFRRNNIPLTDHLETVKEVLKQKLQAKSQRLRRC